MQPGVPADDALWAALGVRCGNVPDTSMEEPVGVTERPELSTSKGNSMAWACRRPDTWLRLWIDGVN